MYLQLREFMSRYGENFLNTHRSNAQIVKSRASTELFSIGKSKLKLTIHCVLL
jgi:hypothetical protein